MRKSFDTQTRLDCSSVQNVQLNLDCRDEIVPILAALKHIYSQPELPDDILNAVAEDVNGTSNANRGRKGMDYWQILVLAAVRLGCNLDYDKLQDLAEQHRALRQIMGIGDWDQQTTFDWRRIQDNITQVSSETIERINYLIVAEGQRLVPGASQTVRADSFVAETEMHYPTESSLLRDGLRKVLELSVALAAAVSISGWRQYKHLYRKARKIARQIDRIAARTGNGYQERLKSLYRELLGLVETITERAEKLRETVRNSASATSRCSPWTTNSKSFWKEPCTFRTPPVAASLRGKRFPTARSCSAFLSRIRSCTSVAKPANRCSSDARC